MNNEVRRRGKDKFDLTFPFSSFSTVPLLSHKIFNCEERKNDNENEEEKGRGKEGREGGKRGRGEKKEKSTYNRNNVLTNLRTSPFENFNSKHSVGSTYGNISVRAPLGKNVLSNEHSSIEKIKISREEKKLKKAEQEFFENEKSKKKIKEEKGFLKISGEEKDAETKEIEIEENVDGKEEIVEDEEEKDEEAKDNNSKNLHFFDSNNLKSVNRENTENSNLRKNDFADYHTSSNVISNLNSNVNYLSKEEEVEIEEELMKLLLSSFNNDKNEIINDDIDAYDNNNNENDNNDNNEYNNDMNYINKYQKQKQEEKQKRKPKYNMKISKNNFSRSQEVNRTGLTEISFLKRSSLPSLNLTITPSLSSSFPLSLPLSNSLKKSYFENKRESAFSTTDLNKTRK